MHEFANQSRRSNRTNWRGGYSLLVFGGLLLCVPGFACSTRKSSPTARVEAASKSSQASEASVSAMSSTRAERRVVEELPYRTIALAREGCRSPKEPGCKSCCRPWSRSRSLHCRATARGRDVGRYVCQLSETRCGSNEPRCARCSSEDERELVELAPLLRSSDSPIDCNSLESLDKCRAPDTPYCAVLRWSEASANCPSQGSDVDPTDALRVRIDAGTAEPGVSAPQGDVEVQPPSLPYTVRSNALDGCRDFKSTDCAFCFRTDYLGVKHFESEGSLLVYSRDIPNAAGVRPCARCMLYDERDLRFAVERIRDCDCSALVHDGVDPCFSPSSCACACQTWIAASIRCPPERIELAQ
jgi:hypothetical protein